MPTKNYNFPRQEAKKPIAGDVASNKFLNPERVFSVRCLIKNRRWLRCSTLSSSLQSGACIREILGKLKAINVFYNVFELRYRQRSIVKFAVFVHCIV